MIEPHVLLPFEDRIASYSKWRIAVRGSVIRFAVHRETHGISGYGTSRRIAAVQQVGGYRRITGRSAGAFSVAALGPVADTGKRSGDIALSVEPASLRDRRQKRGRDAKRC